MNTNNDVYVEGKDAVREVKSAINKSADRVTSNVKTTARDVRRGAARVLDTVSDAADELRDEVSPSLAETAQQKLGDVYDETISYVRYRPIGALAVAALSGAVLALLLRRAVA
jgi:ElaB/YqjD/DUF883 family membrane-anchored ribosome-binding protein